MNRWEYKIINFDCEDSRSYIDWDGKTIDRKKMEKELNILGNEGWEVVGVCAASDQSGRIILKRPR